MIEITSHRQGAVLNHNHGQECDKSLTVKIEGISGKGYPVKVNGIPAEMNGRNFSVELALTQKINNVSAEVITPYGSYSQTLVLVWDKNSFRRSNFYIDDHIFCFTDLAKERPSRAFDHFYFKGLKKINDQFGTKFTLNCFYHNAHHEFLLKDMPDIWKSEFVDNSDWLKFSFHSYSEFPDRPYCEASAEEFSRDWDLVQNEIFRFAGESCYIPPVVIHWANIHPAVAQEVIRRGTRCYSTALRPRIMGGPTIAERKNGGDMQSVEMRSNFRKDGEMNTDGMKLHYGIAEDIDYLDNNGVYFDPLLQLFFFRASGACCNLVPLDKIPERYAQVAAKAEKYGFEVFNCASHEQYTFPYYLNYLPDHMARLECAARCVHELGCTPVFFNEGILGNTAWDK